MRFFLKFSSLAATILISLGCGDGKPSSIDDYKIWGIDVSKHQKNINWEKLIDKECPDFVFMKATEGTMICDPTYATHKKELNEKKILCGAYHFFGHRTCGKEQARNFIKTANLKKGDLRPVLDIEHHRFFKDPKHMIRQVNAFCREIKSYYGVNPIIYCSSNFYTRYLKSNFPEDDYVLWIADYSNHPNIDWKIWQHTESYSISGIGGPIDRNVFAGDMDDLNELILQ